MYYAFNNALRSIHAPDHALPPLLWNANFLTSMSSCCRVRDPSLGQPAPRRVRSTPLSLPPLRPHPLDLGCPGPTPPTSRSCRPRSARRPSLACWTCWCFPRCLAALAAPSRSHSAAQGGQCGCLEHPRPGGPPPRAPPSALPSSLSPSRVSHEGAEPAGRWPSHRGSELGPPSQPVRTECTPCPPPSPAPPAVEG